MLDSSRTYFFGVATDTPQREKKPEQPNFAINDIVYYYAPGERYGETATVMGYWRDDDGRIKMSLQITRTGEEIETYQNRIRY